MRFALIFAMTECEKKNERIFNQLTDDLGLISKYLLYIYLSKTKKKKKTKSSSVRIAFL